MPGQTKSTVDILLAESFKELVYKRPIEKITIKEITDKAGVIRPTFYNHFQDKYELLEWIIRFHPYGADRSDASAHPERAVRSGTSVCFHRNSKR